MSFGDVTYDPERDKARLTSQLARVRRLLVGSRGEWFTLKQIASYCGGSEAAVSARLRDLRKPKFGAWEVERECVRKGLWRYRIAPAVEPAQRTLFTDKEQPHVR